MVAAQPRPGASRRCAARSRRPNRFARPATSKPPTCVSRRKWAAASSIFDVKEGDRVEPGDADPRGSTREIELAVERAPAQNRRGRSAVAAAAGRLATRGHRPGPGAGAGRASEVAAARAELGAAEADLQRFEALLDRNAGSRKQRDDAATQARRGARSACRRRRAACAAEQATARLRAGARPEEIDAARARVAAAAAPGRDRSRESLDDTDAAIARSRRRHREARRSRRGDRPRSPVVVITDLAHAWADVFVPEPVVPRIRLGQAATVFTDAGGSGIAGHRELHLAEGGVHPAQRADGGRALEAGLPRADRRRQHGRACSSRACRSKPSIALQAEAMTADGMALSFDQRAEALSARTRRPCDELSFEVARGEMFGLIGPDGAGKTTSIRLLCGLLHADAGTIRVLGRDPVARPPRDHRPGRLPVAALQPLRRPHHRREHRVLRRDPRRQRLPGPARSAARDDAADEVPRRGWRISCPAA